MDLELVDALAADDLLGVEVDEFLLLLGQFAGEAGVVFGAELPLFQQRSLQGTDAVDGDQALPLDLGHRLFGVGVAEADQRIPFGHALAVLGGHVDHHAVDAGEHVAANDRFQGPLRFDLEIVGPEEQRRHQRQHRGGDGERLG